MGVDFGDEASQFIHLPFLLPVIQELHLALFEEPFLEGGQGPGLLFEAGQAFRRGGDAPGDELDGQRT